jgi:hypothetical protein
LQKLHDPVTPRILDLAVRFNLQRGPAVVLARLDESAGRLVSTGQLQEAMEASGIEYYLRLPGGGSALESDLGRLFDLGVRILVNPKTALVFSPRALTRGRAMRA